MPKYKVNWSLDMGKQQFQKGDTVDLKEKEAEPLLEAGVISTPATEAAKEHDSAKS